MKKKTGTLKWVVLSLFGILAMNLMSEEYYRRWDLTQDGRFTLSEPSIVAIGKFESTVYVDVLLNGALPAEFLRLQREVKLLLEQYKLKNSNIVFDFINPLQDQENREQIIGELQQLGLKPAQVTTEDAGKISQEVIFPWAMVNFGDRSEKVQLLRNIPGANQQERINSSIENLEFAFSDAFSKLSMFRKKTIAVLKGNGELEDRYLVDYLSSLQGYYRIAPFTLDSVALAPNRSLDLLRSFDAVIIAKPTEPFSEAEKLVLDQFVINGGKSLWLVDPVAMDLDSLYNSGSSVALWRDLNLDDLLFKYGVRFNANLVADLICAPVVLATGNGSESEYNPVPWPYYPIGLSQGNHPIVKNLEPVWFRFSGSIDTLQNAYKKTILYQSSALSRVEGVPKIIQLDGAATQPDPERYAPGNLPLAVLVEGSFSSAYANRQKAFQLENFNANGTENKMLFVADGDVVANQLSKGNALELGYDQWTNSFFGNKEFLVNAMNYLLDDNGLINIRNRQVKIPVLDSTRIASERSYWQMLNVGVPALILVLFGILFFSIQKRKYG
ncbi:MAG: hypothetical protein RLZZ241_1791 [Bacteroidota bacterium]|jgi:gliding-associated putative ABC transporter substrate-binding component GldG